MMLSWKMAACLAAGNTVVIKPAQVAAFVSKQSKIEMQYVTLFLQVCPLTALKFAELAVKAGIPPGVINVLPGTGRECGQAIADHPLIRKLGFTGESVSDITATQKNMFYLNLEGF